MADEIVKTEEKKPDAATAVAASAVSTQKKEIDDHPDVIALREQLSNQTKRAEKAELERDERRKGEQSALTEAQKQRDTAVRSQEDAINNAVEAAKSKFESAQAEWDDAYDSGDKKRLKDAQIKLNDAQAELRGSEYRQNYFKEQRERTSKEVVNTGQSKFSKVEQDWIEKHPRFNTDKMFRGAVFAADAEAKDLGIVVDTPAYFRHIESYLKEAGLEKEDGTSTQAQDSNKKEEKKEEKRESYSSSGAPPSGSSSSGSNGTGGKQTFHMTAEHREAAMICYPELWKKDQKAAEEAYAKRQLELTELRRQGRIK